MSPRQRAPLAACAALILLTLGAEALAAQDRGGEGRNGKAWLTGGLGKGSEGIAAVAGVDVSSIPHIVSFRTAATGPLFNGGQTYRDAGVLY